MWATWCAPCGVGLPGLLAARKAAVALVAVSVDENPASIDAFFDGAVPAEVVREPGVAAAVGVGALRATLRVAGGRVVEGVDGARDCSSREACTWLAAPPR